MVFEKSCGAIVFRDELSPDGDKRRYVLMIRQSARSNFSFPKGHVEDGESETETAEREVFEETSVRINISEDFRRCVHYSPRPGAKKEVVYFVALTDTFNVRAQEGEITEAKWIEVEDAPSLLAHLNDKRVLSMALEYMDNKKS